MELWPLAQGELGNQSATFLHRVLSGGVEGLSAHEAEPTARNEYFDILCQGGFPEPQAMAGRSRPRWFSAYLKTVLDREITDSRDIRDREALETMVRYFASTTAQELVMTKVAKRLGIARDTAERYQPWLERVFLIQHIPGWGRGLTSKIVQRPKIYMVDTGLAAALHFREREGREVDLLVETADGRVIGIEIKAATAARSDDFKGLTFLRDRLDFAGAPFVAGIVLHTGTGRYSFGDRLCALPISDLWR